MLRRTKIVATLGPATDDLGVLTDMIRAGLDVVRLNASHGTVEDRRRRLAAARQAAHRADRCNSAAMRAHSHRRTFDGSKDFAARAAARVRSALVRCGTVRPCLAHDVQPLETHGLVVFACQGAAAEFVHGLICAVLAGVAFFGGLTCFLWAAHLRSVQQLTRIHQSQVGVRPGLFG